MDLKNGFELITFSDVNYEILTIEIQYEGEQLAQLNIDKGIQNIEIEVYGFKSHKFPVEDFLQALNLAKEWIAEFQESSTKDN